jgi:hypothetical protein
MNKDGQTDTNKDTSDADFSSIAAALYSGDSDALDRYMAVDGTKDTPDDTKAPDTASKDTDEDKDSGEQSDAQDQVTQDSTDTQDTTTETEASGKHEKKEDDVQEAASAASAASTPDELEQLKQELHRYKSDAGRVPHMQRRMAELERELRASKARSFEGSTDGKSSAKSKNSTDVELDPEVQAEIDELKETDPTLARALERVARSAVAAANSRADHVVETFSKQEQESEDHRFFMEQKAELARMVPKHDEVFALPQWQQWKDTLTPAQRAMAESGYAADVAKAIYAFAADMQRTQGTTPTASDTKQQDNLKDDKVATERARKADTSVDTKNTTARTTKEFNEQDYFKEMYNKAGKESHIL